MFEDSSFAIQDWKSVSRVFIIGLMGLRIALYTNFTPQASGITLCLYTLFISDVAVNPVEYLLSPKSE